MAVEVERVHWTPRNGTMTADTVGKLSESLSRPEAVGLVDFVGRQSDKARAAMLQPILLPPPEEVMDALKDLLKGKLPEADLLGVLKSVQDRGWDKTEAVYTDRARIAKRTWCDITGRARYGVAVAADWLPDGWLADYDGKTTLEAEGDVASARDALALLHKAQAVAEVRDELISEQQQHEAAKAQDELPELRVKVGDADEVLQGQQALLAEARVREGEQKGHRQATELSLRQVQPSHTPQTSLCPKCDTPLMIRGNEIVSCDLTAFGKDEGAKAVKRAALEQKYRAETAKLEDLSETRAVCEKAERLAVIEYQSLKRSLDDLTRKAEVTGEVIDMAERLRRDETKRLREEENSRALAEAEQEMHDKAAVVEVVADAAKATALHHTITRYSVIAEAIGPRGVRNRMLEDGLGNLNAGLAHLANVSGWPMVGVDAKGVVMIAGTHMTLPSVMCSESEKWRAQAMIQLTVGVLSDSRVIMIDRADMLDRDARGGLVKAVKVATAGRPMSVLLCSTGDLDEDTPWRQVAIDKGQI